MVVSHSLVDLLLPLITEPPPVHRQAEGIFLEEGAHDALWRLGCLVIEKLDRIMLS
jgi:hypothetical protein